MADRPWRPPARHWPEMPEVVGGLDEVGHGTWLGSNGHGVVAGVLNRRNTLGPSAGLKSRGTLPLEALKERSAARAAARIASLDPRDYRPFNLFTVDAKEGFWIRATASGGRDDHGGNATKIEMAVLPTSVSMLTAYDLNDVDCPRTRRYLPMFRAARPPEPDGRGARDWEVLLASQESGHEAGPSGAMTVVTATGFGTICSAILFVPPTAAPDQSILWLFAAGRPDSTPFKPLPSPDVSAQLF